MAKLIVVCWRDIPAQVKAQKGRQTVRRELSARFGEAIDRAAMISGARDSDAYLAEWRTLEGGDITGEMEEAVAAAASRLESEWDEARLAATIANGGHRV